MSSQTSLGFALSPPAAPEPDSLEAFFALVPEVSTLGGSSIDRAIRAGVLADRVGYAFAGGYYAATSALLPAVGAARRVAFAVTEAGGGHPRALATELVSVGDRYELRGEKTFVTLGSGADAIVVIARVGERAGRPLLRAVLVPSEREGMEFSDLAPLPIAPEIPHARLRLNSVHVLPADLLSGDGYADYVKPFRTIEDLHVFAALCAHLIALGRRLNAPPEVVATLSAVLASLASIAQLDPKSPECHVALDGAIRILRDPALASSILAGAPSVVRQRFERDSPLLLVAERARAARFGKAIESLAEAPPKPLESLEDEPARALQQDGELILGRLRHYLAEASSGRGSVTRGFPDPESLLACVPEGFEPQNRRSLAEFVEELFERSPWQHHPHYLGHQVSPATPRSVMLSGAAALLNNGMAAFEAGPYVTVLERRLTDYFARVAGFEHGGGFLTNGGSLGNLTALLIARQIQAGFDARQEGLAGHEPLCILVSEQCHYSVERAAQIMGLGRLGVESVRTDAQYRLDPADIGPARQRALARGKRPFAIVASAGATGTGSIDPLPEIAAEARRLGLWFHVDGAHGASALLTERYREPVSGVSLADSLVWDAHKLLDMPALSTLVLLRQPEHAYATFAQQAAYLFAGQEQPWHEIGRRTVECTKTLMVVPLYGSLVTLGPEPMGRAVEAVYDRARELAQLLRAAPDFELCCEPDSNIVCFRHVPAGISGSVLPGLQRQIVELMRQRGTFYCVTTELDGKKTMRVSIMNPRTKSEHLQLLLEAVREAAGDLLGADPNPRSTGSSDRD